jgi:ribulose-5-phosphate 4-epimerase/fuculose-1-phosphate aldolase
MSNLDAMIQDLVIARRILAREEVVVTFGHVSVRYPDNPNCLLIALSLAPELVGREDIVELDLDGQPVRDEGRSLYLERFIHAAVLAARRMSSLSFSPMARTRCPSASPRGQSCGR